MIPWIVAALMVAGAAFMLLASVGVVRFPDCYSRMHAATKSGTLGKVGLVVAVMLYFGDTGVSTRALLVIVFFFLTTPVAAHMIGRAAYRSGVPLWDRTVVDEWKGAGRDSGGEP